jgi:hypothetical protein
MNKARSLAGTALVVVVIAIAALVLVASRPGLKPPAPLPGANVQAVPSAAAFGAPAVDSGVVGSGQFATSGADCSSHVEMVDRLTPTIKSEASLAETVFVGTVVSVDEPRWGTADGKRPDEMSIRTSSVYRVVTFATDAVAKGDPEATIQVRVPGGEVGCETFYADGIPVEIAKGDRYAVFVQDVAAFDSSKAAVPTTTDLWSVAKDGSISTPADGKVTADHLVSSARSAP